MKIITQKIKIILKNKKLSINKAAGLIGEKNSGNLNKMILGNKNFSESFIERFLPILGVTKEEFESWMLSDKYGKEIIKLAIPAKKANFGNSDFVLTVNIDEILKIKKISRSQLAKQAKANQSSLNKVIKCEEGLSTGMKAKIAPLLDVSEEMLQAWVIADKYSLEQLEMALKNFA